MPKLEMDVETTLPPERVREALLDFSKRRPQIWPGITPRDGGGSDVHIEWNREPTSMKGRVAAFVIVRTKGKPVAASFEKAMRRLEASAT